MVRQVTLVDNRSAAEKNVAILYSTSFGKVTRRPGHYIISYMKMINFKSVNLQCHLLNNHLIRQMPPWFKLETQAMENQKEGIPSLIEKYKLDAKRKEEVEA